MNVWFVRLVTLLVFTLLHAVVVAEVPAVLEGKQCFTKANLQSLDEQYEQAIKNADVAFLSQLLAQDFVWVHNLAVLKESKAMLLARVQDADYGRPLTRAAEVQQIQLMQAVAVLSGVSTVTKQDEQNPALQRFNAYQFMRTYVFEDNRCQLLAVQTMKLASGPWPAKPATP